MRRFAWTLVVLLGLSPAALADCESDVKDAIAKMQTSAPFHFVTQEWSRHFMRHSAGRVVPGKAQHIETQVQNGQRGGETINIGEQAWRNDGLGWLGPWSTSWTRDRVTPWPDLRMVEGTCSTIDAPSGSKTREYRFRTAARAPVEPASSVVSIFVDIESGLIVRYERLDSPELGIDIERGVIARGSPELGAGMISAYRHDATIRIAPPIVDMDRRKAHALATFDKEVEHAEQHCRDTVIKLLQAGREAPFKYKIEGGLWDGILSGMHGAFVPPHSIHSVWEGVPRHGGGSERISIGAGSWAKTPLYDWKKVVRSDWNETAVASPIKLWPWGPAPFLDDFLDGAVSYVGSARCPGRGGEAGGAIDYYEYDLYRDTTQGRLRVATQRLYTAPDGARPVKLETIGPQGWVTQVQTRTYMPGLVIEPPVTTAK